MVRSAHPTLSSEATLRELVRRLREGIYVTNRSGDILDANPAFLEMFGVASLNELKNYSAADLLVDPESRRREREILETEGSVRDYELEIRRPDGEIRTVLDTAFAVDRGGDDVVYVGILIDITRHKELEAELREQANRDPLTGCFNRRYLRQIAEKVDPSDLDWGAIVIDIDHFKRYNDEHGHHAGDVILVKTSRYLMREVRAEDALVRFGGDEFVLFLKGADSPTTWAIAERLREKAPTGAPVPFTLGWAVRKQGETLEKTIGRADENLIQVRFEERGSDAYRRSTV